MLSRLTLACFHPVLFRYGSITDGQNLTLFNATTDVYNLGAKGGIGQFPTVLANWTSVLNGTVTALNAIAQIPGSVSIPLAAGQRGSLWFIFGAFSAHRL